VGEKGHSTFMGVIIAIPQKFLQYLITMWGALISSSLLLVSIVVFKWFEFQTSFSSIIVKTSLGPNFMAMAIEFNGKIL